jgi:hypothetical protein
MSNQFVDMESGDGDGATARNYFGESGADQFTTPLDARTVGQMRRERTNPTTSRLRRVSTSILAAGGREDGVSENFGSSLQSQGRDARTAPPTSTSQMRKFVRSDHVPDGDMLTIDVTLKKEDMATAGLSEKFGVARHKIVAGGEEGDQSKSAHVQQVIVGIIHRVKEGYQRSKMMDFMDICTVACLGGNLSSSNPVDWCDGTEINLWTDWDLCSDEQIRRWQFSVNKFFGDGDRIASNWLQAFVYNSSTDSLRTAVAKKYDKLPLNQKGGVVYLYLTLKEMFQMSREVKEAMFKFLDIFKRQGVSRYTGESVLVAWEEILAVCKRLDAVHALQEEHVTDILTGLSICTNKRFRDMFSHLKQSAELDNLDVLGTIPRNATILEQIEAILDKALDMYDKLSIAQIWNGTTKGGPRANVSTTASAGNLKRTCWNCGGDDHQARTCPKPRNKKLYEKNRKAFNEAKANSSGGSADKKGGGDAKLEGADYQRKKWADQGMSLINGVLHLHCKHCGYNTTHATKTHSLFEEQGESFRLNSTHPYVKECAKLNQKYYELDINCPPSVSDSSQTVPRQLPDSTSTIRVLINYKVEMPELQGQLHIMTLRIPTVGLVPEDLAPKCHVEPQERLRVTV